MANNTTPGVYAPTLNWDSFNKNVLSDYFDNGYINNANKRNNWNSSLGLDLGGKYSVGIDGFDWSSFNQGTATGNLDDMGMPVYTNNPNAAADRQAAWEKLLADPNTIYNINTDRVNSDGSMSGGNTRSTIGYKRVGNQLVPVSQRDFTNSSDTKDFLSGLAAFAAVAGGGNLLLGDGLGAAGSGGLSGMDLAADAALGSGNSITTAGGMLGGGTATGGALGGSGLIPGTGTTGLQAGGGVTTGLGNSGLGSGVAAGAGETLGTAGSGLTVPGATAGAGGAAAGAGGLGGLLNNAGNAGNVIRNVVGGAVNGGAGSNGGGQGSGGVSTITDLLNLLTNGVNYNRYDNLVDEIKGIYSPDGAYAKTLENRLARQDAAAGRNSQYGPRLAQLMGSLGDSQAKALQGLSSMFPQQQGALNGAVGSIDRILGGAAQGGLNSLLNSIFGSGGSSSGGGSTSSPDWSNIDWDNWFNL
jgi:hypothetical protein